MIEAFVNDTLRNATPIVLAACGGLVTRLSGWLNIGLEGMILLSAFSGVVVSSATSSVVVGTLAAIATSIAVSLLIFVMVRYMRANLYITGIATNLLSGGLT
ncbi:MAG: ABC transporter permease, partial [Mesotoga sp.]|nr:ABC transporter permease [Mesotoga sp.]